MKNLSTVVNNHIDLLDPLRAEIGLMAVLVTQSDFDQAQGLGYVMTRWADILDQAGVDLGTAVDLMRAQEPEPEPTPEPTPEEMAAAIRKSIERLQMALDEIESADQDATPMAGGAE